MLPIEQYSEQTLKVLYQSASCIVRNYKNELFIKIGVNGYSILKKLFWNNRKSLQNESNL